MRPGRPESSSEGDIDNITLSVTTDKIKTVRKSYRDSHKSSLDYMSRTDREASDISRKGARMFSYKQHFAVDQMDRVITAVAITPGAIMEDRVLEELLEK